MEVEEREEQSGRLFIICEVDVGEEEPSILKYIHTKLECEFLPVNMGSFDHVDSGALKCTCMN